MCIPQRPTPPPTPPTPPRPGQGDGSVDGFHKSNGTECTVSGWCSGPGFSGPSLQARLLLDSSATPVANGTANVPRSKAGYHGFLLQLPCSDATAAGEHTLEASCSRDGAWFKVGKDLCFKDGQEVRCP